MDDVDGDGGGEAHGVAVVVGGGVEGFVGEEGGDLLLEFGGEVGEVGV